MCRCALFDLSQQYPRWATSVGQVCTSECSVSAAIPAAVFSGGPDTAEFACKNYLQQLCCILQSDSEPYALKMVQWWCSLQTDRVVKLVLLLLLLQVVVKSLAAMCCGSQRNQDLARQAGSYIHTDNNAVACHANITLWLKVKWFDWVAGGLHGWRRGRRDGECSKLASSSSHPHIPPSPPLLQRKWCLHTLFHLLVSNQEAQMEAIRTTGFKVGRGEGGREVMKLCNYIELSAALCAARAPR